MEMTRLTLKQQKFVDEYINNGGNGSKAVISAGYNATTENSIRSIASENLMKPMIRLALEQAGYKDCGIMDKNAIDSVRSLDNVNRRISTREDRAEFLTSIYEDNSYPIVARLKAIELLGKMYGDYLDRVVLEKEEIKMPTVNIIMRKND